PGRVRPSAIRFWWAVAIELQLPDLPLEILDLAALLALAERLQTLELLSHVAAVGGELLVQLSQTVAQRPVLALDERQRPTVRVDPLVGLQPCLFERGEALVPTPDVGTMQVELLVDLAPYVRLLRDDRDLLLQAPQ